MYHPSWEGGCKAIWKRGLKLSWREAGPPNHLDDKTDQLVGILDYISQVALHLPSYAGWGAAPEDGGLRGGYRGAEEATEDSGTGAPRS